MSGRGMTADQIMTVPDWQGYIGDWADGVFTQSTPETILAHYKLEVAELEAAHASGDFAHAAEEAADNLIMLIQYCHKMKIDLGRALRDKMKVNNNRRWNPPNEDGIVFHRKEE